MTVHRRLKSFLVLIVCVGLTVIILFPVVWGILLSLKTRVDALAMPPTFLFAATLSNYKAAFIEGPYWGTIVNSVIIASVSSLLAMLLGVPAAYAFSRSTFKGKDSVLLSLLTVRMAPATVIALPLFIIFSRLGLIDSYVAIILVHAGVSVALAVWIMKGFFDEIPREIDEASMLDGDSRYGAMLNQVLPLCVPGLLVTMLFCFLNSWNEFFLALMLTGYESRPFTVAVPALVTPHGTYWGQVTAISTVGLLPGLVFALLCRKYLTREVAGRVGMKSS
ncbi:MAG: polyol transport system permease protein [Blastocatellia bacterium]|jgi:multiple sugar transport system permease protein|nr:polyol transport system permease protein [Blastocatellia bacterium]